MRKILSAIFAVFLLLGLVIPTSIPVYAASDEAEILTYSFPEQIGPVTINSGLGTVGIEVAHATDVTDLVATFTTSDVITSIKVGGVDQVSGTTANDFTSPVTYVVIAEDGITTKNWVVTVTVALPAPTVTSIFPTSGLIEGGTSITITGTNFVSGASVTIGGGAATGVVFNSSTSITAITPEGTAGAKNVMVTNPDTQFGTLSGGFTYMALPPRITVTSPDGGESWAPGSTHNIMWTHASIATWVRIELYKGGTLVKTIAPFVYKGAFGSGSYSWPIPLGQSAGNDYRIIIVSTANPSVSDVSNADFYISIIPTLTITVSAGANGSITPGTGLVAESATPTYTITANPGYHIADVLVDGGSVGAVSSYTFAPVHSNHTISATFAAGTPAIITVTSLVPNAGVQGATLNAVVINGTGLTGATAVNFSGAGVTASGLAMVNDTQLTANIAIASDAALGTRAVTVTTPNGTSAALVRGFTVTALPPPVVSIGSPVAVLEGEIFVVNVNIDAVTDLASWQYAISYNPAVIQVIGAEGGGEGVTAGLMNGTRVIPVDMWIFSPLGTQGAVIALQSVPVLAPVNGTGYLAQVHFQVLPGTAGQSSFLNFIDLPGTNPPFTRGIWASTEAAILGVTWVSSKVDVIASPGDANGDGVINMGDVTKVQRVILGLDPLSLNADANEDGVVNMGDVTKIMRIILGLV